MKNVPTELMAELESVFRPIFREQLRMEAAVKLLPAMIAGGINDPDEAARAAVRYAGALMRAIDEAEGK